MWLLTKVGFFSIVEKPWDRGQDTLTVRSRVRTDLETFIAFLPRSQNPTIVEDKQADYQFRIQARRFDVEFAVMQITMRIDYDNFKDAVGKHQGYPRARLYGQVWSTLYELQSRAKTLVAGLTLTRQTKGKR